MTALARQIPLLFAILTANALVLAVTHLRPAPLLLAGVMPALLVLAGIMRIRHWRGLDLSSMDHANVLRMLRRVFHTVTAFGILFTAWSLALYPYGDAYARCHVAFFMSITVISCILCLTHHRGAALVLTFIVTIPFTIFFLLTGNLVLIAMAVNFVLVAWGLILIMLGNYNSFAGLIVSQRKAQLLSDENLRLAHLDGLTALPNRRSFLAELDDTLAAARAAGTSFAVAMIDLDRFKSVNDTYGHGAGDRLLEQVGMRLNDIAGPDLFIARLGGDEFGAILKNSPDEAAILAFGALVQVILEPPFAINMSAMASIGCSIGVATYPQTRELADELFECADYALYEGKQHRRGETILFSPKLETQIRLSSQIEQALRTADLARELYLVFQPIIDATTNRTVGFESLARWESRELGLVSPGLFIPIAERAQLINQITLALFAKYLASFPLMPPGAWVSFNLSAHDLGSRAIMSQIHHMLRHSGVASHNIVFEITESALLQDFDQAAETIASLHEMGAAVALDDFGSGFSSLGYIHRLKLDKIKIDACFVRDIETNVIAPKIIRSLVELCRNLDLVSVVEGVETKTQLDLLLSLGARQIQGYFFARPMRPEAIPAFLADRHITEPTALPIPHQRRQTSLTR